MTRRNTIVTAAILAAAGLAFAPDTAHAQDALGDGRGLERDLGVGVPQAAPRRIPGQRDFSSETQFRNAIVTGNAPGGLSFREDVGYTSPRAFRGELGSDDLFSFRRDSLFSGLGGRGLRGTEALQYQFALTSGGRTPSGFLGPMTYERFGAGATGFDAQAGRIDPSRIDDPDRVVRPRQTGLEFDPGRTTTDSMLGDGTLLRDGTMLGTLRSTSAFVTSQVYQPALLGYAQGPDGDPYGLTASSLRGVRYAPLWRPEPTPTRDERVHSRIDTDARQPGAADTRLMPERLTGPDLGPRTAYEALLDRLREAEAAPDDPGAPTPPDATDWEQRLDSLREQMRTPPEWREEDPDAEDPESVFERLQRDHRGRMQEGFEVAEREQLREEGERTFDQDVEVDPVDVLGGPLDAATLERIRQRSGMVDTFSDGVGTDTYSRHIMAGERLMSGGRYFDAEERFTRALASRPNDVDASIGRIHAQIGAGMYLSAASNLRLLLTTTPEIAGVRYGDALLPAPERMTRVLQQLRRSMGQMEDGENVRLGPESALLLAYLGHQRQDSEDVQRGLAVLRDRAAPGAAFDSRLVELLEALWDGDDDTPDPEPEDR